MNGESEITRTIAIEHAGEKIHVEVHVHLTPEDRHKIAQMVIAEISKQIRYTGNVVTTTAGRTVTTAAGDFQMLAN